MASTYKKVPVILQMEALECGAASLGMILAYYGRFIPLEQLRVDCGVSRDGSKATNILAAARFHGMKAKGYRYSVEKVKELPTFPVIIHWNFNHFVVLDGFKKNRAVINDPASGIVEVSMEEFERSYTGITLVVEPGETFEPSGKKKSTWDFLGKYAKKNRAGIIGIILCGFLIAMLNIAIPVFSKIFMDYILLASASEWMGYLTKAMLVETIALFVLRMILAVLMLRAQKTVSMQMNVKFMWHSLRLPVEFYGQRSSGDISGRQMDNEVITKLFFGRIAPAVIDVLMAIIYFVVLIILHPKMALISFVAVLRQFVSVKVMAGKNQIASKSVSRDEGKYTGAAMAGISMIETIKASGAEEGYFRKIVGYLTKYNNSQTKLNSHMLVTTFLPDLMAKLCNAVVLIVGVYYILNGEITIGFLLAFQGFVAQFLDPIGAVLMIGSEIQQVISKLERVEDVLNYEPDVKEDFLETPEETVEYTRLSGAMECRDLCFGYGRLSPLFIENFNMTVRPGEIVALVGGSGSGKSTLANLITGIYPPRSGEILFDGKQRLEIDRYVFTQSVGIINQTISLFRDTIRNNLTLWDNKVEDQVVLDACKVAGIFDDIMTRPERLDFMLTEGGKNMSGGQRQRLEIARALIKRPSLLILDEATSALDPPTEKHVMDAIRDRKITCIIIAHRLSTIRNADQIIMLERGKVVEVGNHESLIEADGAYARLVKSE